MRFVRVEKRETEIIVAFTEFEVGLIQSVLWNESRNVAANGNYAARMAELAKGLLSAIRTAENA